MPKRHAPPVRPIVVTREPDGTYRADGDGAVCVGHRTEKEVVAAAVECARLTARRTGARKLVIILPEAAE